MYKVKQIAEMLNVETVAIHEVLIEMRDVLAPHVVRKNSILYVDYDGYQQIKKTLERSFKEVLLDSNKPVIEGDELENPYSETPSFETNCLHDIESIKEKISLLKQDINRIDLQIYREEEVLHHYQQAVQADLVSLKNEIQNLFFFTQPEE